MNQEKVLHRIRILLARFQEEVIIGNLNGEFSINIHAENVLLKVLNVAYDLELHNVNYEEGKNYPAIDLRDENRRTAFQITSTGTVEKAVHTLEQCVKNGLDDQFDNLYIYFLKGMAKNVKPDNSRIANAKGNFELENIHLIDHVAFYQYLNHMNDMEKNLQIEKLLEDSFIGYNFDTFIGNYIFYKSLIESLGKEKYEEILEKTIQTYDESGKILLYNPYVKIPKKEIVLPSREIINGVNILQRSFVEAVQRDHEFIYNMSPRQFEEFVAELYEKQGYRVELTKMTRDGGKDIILYTDGPTGHNMFYVECKKYRKSNLVDVSIVRNFYGVVEADKATAGILVTSSSFTPDARSFEKQVFHRMTLVDYVALLNEVAKIRV